MTVTERQIFEADGRAIPFIDEGVGPALVLLPAAGLDFTYLGTLASILVEEDFRVLRVGSRRPGDAAVTMHDLAQDVIDVMTAVGLDEAWIGGHAFGGALARTVALDHTDRVSGVLVLGVEGEPAQSEAAASALETVLSEASDDEILAVLPHVIGATADASAIWNILGRSRDLEVLTTQREALAATPVAEWEPIAPGIPALIIQGEDDLITAPVNGERLRASAPELATVVVVPGAAHLFAATHPGETSWIIEDYLDWD